MRVAFMHVEEPTYNPEMQRNLANMMVASVKKAMPDIEVLQMTDTTTKPIEGVDEVRVIEIDGPWLMPYRLKHLAALDGENIILDTDIIVREDLREVFKHGFQLALTRRDIGLIDGLDMPYNIGVMFSRCPEFWQEAYEYCLTLPENQQMWFGDQIAVKYLVDAGKYKIGELDCDIWNYSPNTKYFDPSEKKVIHFKGTKRKLWMLTNNWGIINEPSHIV